MKRLTAHLRLLPMAVALAMATPCVAQHNATTVRHDEKVHAMRARLQQLQNEGKARESVALMAEMNHYVEKHPSACGTFSNIVAMGTVYRYRGDYKLAVKAFEDALDYERNYMPGEFSAYLYTELCRCRRRTMNYKELLATAERGLKGIGHRQGRGALLLNKCYALYALGKDEEFRSAYHTFCSLPTTEQHSTANMGQAVRAFALQLDGQGDEAEKLINNLALPAERWLANVVVYRRQGNLAAANRCLRQLVIVESKQKRSSIENDLAILAAQLNEHDAELERAKTVNHHAQLELQHTQLELHNAQLELRRTHDAERLAKMETDRKKLSLRNLQLKDNRMKDSLSNQRFMEQASHRESKIRKYILMAISASLAVLTILIICYIIFRRKLNVRLFATNRRLLEAHNQLEIANEEAQQADMQKTKFVQSVSHEVRTPLNAIVGFSGVLSDMEDMLSEEEKTDLLQRIKENSESLDKLINDVLDLTTLESGRYQMKHEPVNINQLCQEALERTRHLVPPMVHTNHFTVLSRNLVIMSDYNRLLQVLINLLSNALKFTEKGMVTLSSTISRDRVLLIVTDMGTGIPEDKAEEIFERFKKLDSFKQGTGLGLCVCREIAKKLGGTIKVDTDYHEGARFVLSLPKK